MRAKRYLNGCDYLMLGFDRELRRRGYAGNSCQVIVELGAPIDPDVLRRRLAELLTQHPLLASRPAGAIRPHWKAQRAEPAVRLQRDEPGLRERLFNDPLDVRRGELLRFDLVERDGQAMDVVLTWAHALMDARAAEHLLTRVGRDELPPPVTNVISAATDSFLSPAAGERIEGRGQDGRAGMSAVLASTARHPSPYPLPQGEREPSSARNTDAPPAGAPAHNWFERWRMAWRATCHVEQLAKAPPRRLRLPDHSVPPVLKYRVEKFSAEETARVRGNASRLCGFLGQAQFDAAASVLELHHLHQRLGTGSPSYCLPLPVGLRPKGSIEPLFSNQVAMLLLQFLPGQLDSLPPVVAALKTQIEQALRNGLLENSLMLADVSRWVPLPLYMPILKHGLGGEIASLFYGDAGTVNPLLTTFLGAPVVDVAHVAAVTPSPGLGVIFCRFQNRLRLSVIHAAPILSDPEAAEFATHLRRRLLNPSYDS